jgi:CHAD domain-containing protein
VHAARRAMKPARSLLRLVDPWPGNSHIETMLRDAGRFLAVFRDADVLVLTAEDIREGSGAAPRGP